MEKILKTILEEIASQEAWDENSIQKIMRKHLKGRSRMFSKEDLVRGYREYFPTNEILAERIKMKPTRTNSGVATVTVLTKPYPCPGNCIYCPNDPLMPKSYISSEPGAQRALKNEFDPYAQVFNRLLALKNVGHSVEKIELIVLGGSWTNYPGHYRLSFVYACYMALNDFRKDTMSFVKPWEKKFENLTWEDIEAVHKKNEGAYCRNVGLVFETRPDLINQETAREMRMLGATKVQMGIQTLDEAVLKNNDIGRGNREVVKAFEVLRLMGFKIHAHWMPNLHTSTPKRDINDFRKLWRKEFCPDELKIYPTSVIPNTRLHELYEEGLYKPYTEEDLKRVVRSAMLMTPRYCRLTRIIRDIPSNEISAGNKKTNLRQIVENEIKKDGLRVVDIRSREIKGKHVHPSDIHLREIVYKTSVSKEIFLSYETSDDEICGFLRLSLPKKKFSRNHFEGELKDSALIREVHVYGKVLGLREKNEESPQHIGIGKSLIEKAELLSRKDGYPYLSVISAIGTREYYRKRGFEDGSLYMRKSL